MLRHLMTSWHLNIWKSKIWLSQEQNQLSKWNKKHFSLFHKWHTIQTSKNVADTTFNPFQWEAHMYNNHNMRTLIITPINYVYYIKRFQCLIGTYHLKHCLFQHGQGLSQKCTFSNLNLQSRTKYLEQNIVIQ